MYGCETCIETFWHQYECEDHMDDYDHWPECESCTRIFRTQRACDQYMNDTSHWAPRFDCETCSKDFRSHNAANQHMTAVGHWASRIPCETCERKFHTQDAAHQHTDALGHWAPKISCETCSRKFSTQSAANKHMKSESHYRNCCKHCDLQFRNANDLEMVELLVLLFARPSTTRANKSPEQHLNSKTHRGTNVPCPFCKTNYTSASGLTHHLERGACHKAPKLNRETILTMIRKHDQNSVLTTKQIDSNPETNIIYSATKGAFNGTNWECYICHKQFTGIAHLNTHLNSPVHKAKVYRCPNAKVKCGKQLITLAGLFNHLESESCGFMRVENVQRQVGNVLSGRMLIKSS